MELFIHYDLYVSRYPTKLLALYHALRDAMLDGRLAYGAQLPSTRELARRCGLSRGTVNQTYDMLAAEGYVECVPGSGTFAAYRNDRAPQRKGALTGSAPRLYRLSPWGERLTEEQPGAANIGLARGGERISAGGAGERSQPAGGLIDFSSRLPDDAAFPREAWLRCLYAQARGLIGGVTSAADPAGEPPLREALAQLLRRTRGIAADPAHIAVTGGSMQALALLAQLLLGPGDAAVAETPGYAGIRRAVWAAGGRCVDAIVDAHGIVPADWDARALFATPARQFPTGAVLPLERRQALLRWAETRDAVIVEDDYDSDFRHRGKSLEPLKALDRDERVVFIGSFTKTLPPSLRIGYAVLPPGLAEPFRRAQALYEPQPVNRLEQLTLAAFMQSGEYERHLRRMKRIYGRKFHALAQLTEERLARWFDWVPGDAGLHVFGWWKGTAEAFVRYRALCAGRGVRWAEAETNARLLEAGTDSTPPRLAAGTAPTDGEPFPAWPPIFASPPLRLGIYLCFSHLNEEQLRAGVQIMQEAAEAL